MKKASKRSLSAISAIKGAFSEWDTGNYIALSGLILALGSLGWQIVGYFLGPIPRAMAPESVTFRHGEQTRGDTNQASISITANNVNFINEARKDYDAIVKSIAVNFEVAGKTYRLVWWYFMKDATRNEKEQAGPFVIPAGGGVSKEVRFFARLRPCAVAEKCMNEEAYADFVPWTQLAGWIADAKVLPFLDLAFNIEYLVPEKRTEIHRCRITFPDAVRAKFASDPSKIPYQSLPCVVIVAKT